MNNDHKPDFSEQADCGVLSPLLTQLAKHLDQFLAFKHADAMENVHCWKTHLATDLPFEGVGIEQVIAELGKYVIVNGSAVPNPACTAFITTGASNMAILTSLASIVASPQRFGHTAFNFLEEHSLNWLVNLFDLPTQMKGIYSSGGSSANIIALGAARQQAFEAIGIDPAEQGIQQPCRIYATEGSHHTIHRAAAVLGLGRRAITTINCDHLGRMCIPHLRQQLNQDRQQNILPVAIVATAGTTSTGVIDPLAHIGEVAKEFNVWFHVDGAYGLPGKLDPKKSHLYEGLSHADSIIVDPHKWLGAPVGIGATFVRDRSLLTRAFSQGTSDYLEGSFTNDDVQHSMDSMGIPYNDMGLELSSPSRGAIVWAMLKEIGEDGLRSRICRHNAMAKLIAKRALSHPNLELLQQPTLSICCFRYYTNDCKDLNALNRRIHRQLVQNGRNIPSTAILNGKLAIRPCFIGAKTTWEHAESLVEEVVEIGNRLIQIK